MSADWKIWTVIIGLAVATYVIRFSFLGMLAGRKLPDTLTRALGFVPVTVLPALIAPMVLAGPIEGQGIDAAKIAAAVAALVLGMITRNVLGAIFGGVAGFALVSALGG
jgi:branched-subunit amino acid transport protein